MKLFVSRKKYDLLNKEYLLLNDDYEKLEKAYEEKYDRAISWYEIILSLPIPDDCCQCRHICCLRFKPHLNLCYCYFLLFLP